MKLIAITTTLWLALVAPKLPALSADRVVVVCSCSLHAYQEALVGIRQTLGREPEVVNLDAGGAGALRPSARRDSGKIYIAVGRDALHAALSEAPKVSVIGTMMLREDAPNEAVKAVAEIDLDVPPRLLLRELRRLFPRKTRLGILLSRKTDRAALLAGGSALGFSVQFREVSDPADLAKAFLSFKGNADLVLTLPDKALYNGATVPRLVLASLESRIPIIGFSATFVRAGAAAGIFADFQEAGRQAAEIALRYDPGNPQRTVEQARKLTVAVNQRIFRLLGLEYEPKEGVEVYR